MFSLPCLCTPVFFLCGGVLLHVVKFKTANCMRGLCMPSVISIILLKHCCAVTQAVSMPQPQAGPSIEDAAQLLSSVAQPLFLSLHSQRSDSLHDSQDQQVDFQQPPQHNNVLQPVTGNGSSIGNGISNSGHSHDIVSTRNSGGFSSSGSSQNPHGELTYPYSPEGFTSDAQDLQTQVWVCKPSGFLACNSRSVLWLSA